MDKKTLYRVIFANQGKVYELFARRVAQGGLFGFVEIGELSFGEHTSVVVDPSEERLKQEFEGVESFYVPMHAIIRIDVVNREGSAKVTDLPPGGNVTPFPGFYSPPGDKR